MNVFAFADIFKKFIDLIWTHHDENILPISDSMQYNVVDRSNLVKMDFLHPPIDILIKSICRDKMR